MDLPAAVSSLAAAHPYAAFAAGVLLGPVWPKAITWAVSDGVDWAVPKILAFQKFYLAKIGATDAQVHAIEGKEAAVLARAAADVQKDAGATDAAPAAAPQA